MIGGFTAPRGARTDLGALLVGDFEGDRLRYAGKVGTGFTRATLREPSERLAPLVRETPAFEPDKGLPRAATWVEPELVAQIAFMEWTPDNATPRGGHMVMSSMPVHAQQIRQASPWRRGYARAVSS